MKYSLYISVWYGYLFTVSAYSATQVAELLGVTADTIRRWCDEGRLASSRPEGGHRSISGVDLASFLSERTNAYEPSGLFAQSARNRITGIVTKIETDKLTAVVEIAAPPHRIVSLMTREAVEEMSLDIGDTATAAIKSTNVIIEVAR